MKRIVRFLSNMLVITLKLALVLPSSIVADFDLSKGSIRLISYETKIENGNITVEAMIKNESDWL